MKVLVTGGAGYIGSTICSALEDQGHSPVVLDSLVSGRREFTRGRAFYQGDVADTGLLEHIVSEHPDIACIIHLAALIVIPESVEHPGAYYRENSIKALKLFEFAGQAGIHRVIFSSSASIYDTSQTTVVTEESPLKPLSPYARTKLVTELMLEDLCASSALRGLALRYFNPVGADPQFRSGPYLPQPSHVLGKLVGAARNHQTFEITGTDYPTRDGTGLRDYIHIWDLARAHVRAAEHFDTALSRARAAGLGDHFVAVNLGTGQGNTVRELLKAFKGAYGAPVASRDGPRRPGDTAGAYADIGRARELLDWAPELSLQDALASALHWEDLRAQVLAGA